MLRVALAVALTVLMLPLLGSGASAEDATLAQEEAAGETQPLVEEGAQETQTPPPVEEDPPPADEVGETDEVLEPGANDAVTSSVRPQADTGSATPMESTVQSLDATSPVETLADNTTSQTGELDKWEQCENGANGAPYSPSDPTGTACTWVTGNLTLNANNYAEGDYVLRRARLTGLAAGLNEYVMNYDVKVQGKWAYDELYVPGVIAVGATTVATDVTIVPGSGTTDRTDVARIVFDAPTPGDYTVYIPVHIASELEYGPGMGAGSLSGSNYHTRAVELNGRGLGNRDLQMQSSAVKAGYVTVAKAATPEDGTDFSFRLSGGGESADFVLDVDDDPTYSHSVTYRIAPGDVTATETGLPAGWSLDDLVCTGTTAVVDLASRSASFALENDDEVTCTFTNSKVRYADLTVAKSAKASYDRDYDWTITKDVDGAAKKYDADGTASFDYDVVVTPGEPQDSGFRVSGRITVSNPNPVSFTGVSLVDAIGGQACAITQLDGSAFAQPFSVPADGDVTVKYACDLADGSATTSGTNTATATWDAGAYYGTTGSAADSAAYDFADATVSVTDETVTVTDDRIDLSGLPGGDRVTAPDTGRFDYSIEYTATRAGECTPFENTASITDDGEVRSDSETVRICKGSDLEVSKNRLASLTRTYAWDVVKARESDPRVYVDPTTGKATVDYSVVVSAGIGTDSAWLMTGTVEVENPNDWPVELSSVSDAYPGMSCSLVPAPTAEDLVVPADGSAFFDYRCTAETKPSYVGTNTATATWDAATYGTPTGSDTGAASVVEADWDKTLVNDEVTVVDDGAGEDDPQQWGPFTWSDGWVSDPVPYTLELSGVEGECVDYRNTVEVLGDGEEVLASHYADVEVCWPLDLSVRKDADASYDTRYFWDIEKSVDPEDPVHVSAGDEAEFDYTVKAIPKSSEDSGWDLTGTITVANPNGYTDVEVTLSDVYDNGTPEPGDDVVCTVTYPGGLEHLVVPRATASGPGTATATYDCDFASRPSYTGKNHVTVLWGEDGEASSYADVEFEQDGTTDKTVEVYDDKVDLVIPEKLGEATWAWADGKPVPTVLPAYTQSFEGVAGTCTDYTNTAWVEQMGENPEDKATATVCAEADLTVEKKVEATYEVDHHWLVDKSVDRTLVELTDDGEATFAYTVEATPDGSSTYGYAMSGTIEVTNPNQYPGGTITATVTDVPAVGGGAECTVAGGESVTLAPEQSRTLDFTCSFTDKPSHSGSNTATATWTGPDQEQHSVSDTVPVSFSAEGGRNATVTVTDDLVDPSTLGTAVWNAAGTPTVFTYTLTHEGVENTCVDHTNTATIVETGQSDSQTVTVCDQGDLVVAKSVEATYDRTYEWDITKVADRDRLDTVEGEPGTVGYTVGVTPTGYVDSGWEMSGVVTVTNPNTYKDVTVELTDVPDLGEGAACVFDETEDLLVAAGGTRTFAYTCSFTEQPAYDGSNTVVVDWGDGTVSATTDAVFEPDVVMHETVTVSDDLLDPSELGTVTWNEDGETVELEYTMELEGPLDACETVTNTATIVETGQEAQAEVLVCGPEILPTEGEVPRPPAILPETGAPAGVGLWTTLGGLMVALGVTLLVLRRRSAS